jgi:hypothetical protein
LEAKALSSLSHLPRPNMESHWSDDVLFRRKRFSGRMKFGEHIHNSSLPRGENTSSSFMDRRVMGQNAAASPVQRPEAKHSCQSPSIDSAAKMNSENKSSARTNTQKALVARFPAAPDRAKTPSGHCPIRRRDDAA